MTIDLAAAQHCVRIALSDYRRRRVNPPEWLKAYARSLFSFAGETESSANRSNSAHEFIHAKQAAEILGCSPQWVRHIAADLDGQRVGRIWVFSRRSVADYAGARRGSP